MNLNARLEHLIEGLVGAVTQRPKLALWSTLVFVAVLTAGMPRLYIDVTNESLFRPEDPSLKQYQAFQAQFGRDDTVIAAIESPKIFSRDFLGKLEAYHRDLEKSVPFLDQVTSLVSVTSVSSRGNDIVIDELRDIWPENEADFPSFQKSVVENPLYKNLVISHDGDVTLLVIRPSAFATAKMDQATFRDRVIGWHDRFRAFLEGKDIPEPAPADAGEDAFKTDFVESAAQAGETKPLTTQQLEAFVHAVRNVTAKHQADGFTIKLAGGSLIAVEHAESIHADFAKLIPFVFLLVLVVLYLVLRRISAVFLPLLILVLTLLSTLGLMGWFSWPITPVIVALPTMLLTTAVGDSVHMLSIYLEREAKTGERAAALSYTVRRTSLAVLFTSLTTAAGFLSFLVADIKPVADFGVLVAFGVMLALLLTLVLIPAILTLMPSRPKNDAHVARHQAQSRWISKLFEIGFNHYGKVLAATAVIVAVCIPGITQLRFSHDPLKWFPQDKPVRVNTLAIDDVFRGTIPLEIVIDTGKPNGIYAPDFLRRLEAFETYAEKADSANIAMGRTTSVVDTLKRIHGVMNNEAPAQSIPDDDKLVAQELLLFESSGAEDVEKLIDSQFSKVRVTARMSWADAVDYLPVRMQLEQKAKEMFSGAATVTTTGTIDLVSRALVGVMQSMLSSYLLSGLIIGLMMIMLLKSVRWGLASMVPNTLPIVISLAIMGYTGMPLDMFTVLFGGIALGLAVDDTIHLWHGYRHHRDNGMSMEDSMAETVSSAGVATLYTSIAMATGFLTFMFSTMDALFSFGLLLAVTIILAWVADVLLGPAMIRVTERFTSLEPVLEKG